MERERGRERERERERERKWMKERVRVIEKIAVGQRVLKVKDSKEDQIIVSMIHITI